MLNLVGRPNLLAGVARLLVLVGLSVGCGANLAPVLEVDNAPVAPPAGVAATRELVHDAIIRALASRTWAVVEDDADGIVAEVSAGGHSASVLVRYDARSYSIHRVSSSDGLKYDGTRIHRRYNHWIDRLRASIGQELNQLQPQAVNAG